MATVPAPTDASAPSARREGRQPSRWQPVFEAWLAAFRRTYRATLVGGFLSPVLFLLSMGLGLGSLVDKANGGIDGVPYLQFVVPGILAAQGMMVASRESTYWVLGAIRWQMQYHAMLATPIEVRDILRGHLTYVAAQIGLATVIFASVSTAFGAVRSWWFLLCVPLTVLTGMAFAVPMFAFSAKQEGDDGFNILFRFVVTPLFLFSGTFFPVEQLPVWLRPVAWLTPLWHGVDGNRELALGSPDLVRVAGHVAFLLVVVAVGWWLAYRSFMKRLVV